jgi:hypothetical protein
LERLFLIGHNNIYLTRPPPTRINDFALTNPILGRKMRAKELSNRSLVYVAAIPALRKPGPGFT